MFNSIKIHQVTRFVLIVFLFVNFSWSDGYGEQIIIYRNDNKPPKYYLDNGEPSVILIKIMKHIDNQLPQKFEYQLYPWKRAYRYALEGSGGIIGLSKNKQRLELFDFSEPLYYDELIMVTLKGLEFAYHSIEDLAGKTLGGNRGSSYGDDYERLKKICTIEEDNGQEQRLLKLLARRIDVALIGPGRAGLNSAIMQNEYLQNNREQFSILPTPLPWIPIILVSRSSCRKSNSWNYSIKLCKTAGSRVQSITLPERIPSQQGGVVHNRNMMCRFETEISSVSQQVRRNEWAGDNVQNPA